MGMKKNHDIYNEVGKDKCFIHRVRGDTIRIFDSCWYPIRTQMRPAFQEVGKKKPNTPNYSNGNGEASNQVHSTPMCTAKYSTVKEENA